MSNSNCQRLLPYYIITIQAYTLASTCMGSWGTRLVVERLADGYSVEDILNLPLSESTHRRENLLSSSIVSGNFAGIK